MKTHVLKLCVYLAALSAVALTGPLARAEWFYDFNNGPVPASLLKQGWLGNLTPTQRFTLSAQGDFLTMSDSLPVSSGGTAIAEVLDPEVFDGNLRVSASVNSGGYHSPGLVGLIAMGLPVHYGSYFAAIDLGLNVYPGSNRKLWVGKGFDDFRPDVVAFASGTVPSLTSEYFMELDVAQTPAAVTLTGRVYDHEGGTELLEASLVDTGFGGVPAYRSGISGVFGSTANILSASFDNIRAVPEPTTVTLLSAGALGLLGFAWRRRVR